MALATQVTINIDGNELPDFTILNIQEKIMQHHTFEIICRMDKLEGSDHFSMEKSQEYIGGQINIKISADSQKREGTHIFRGLITEVIANRNFGIYGDSIILKGYSPDIILEDRPHTQSFEEKDLEQIIQNTLKAYDKQFLKQKISLKSSSTFLYKVQYKETSFEFLLRECIKNGEWWCFDGEKLHIGELPDKDVELTYGIDLHDFDFSIKLEPSKFQYSAYSYLSAKGFESSSDAHSIDKFQNRFGKTALSKSDEVFLNEKISLFNETLEKGNEQQNLDDIVHVEREGSASRMVTAQGMSESLEIVPGCRAKIKGYSNDDESEIDYGEYIITTINHSCDRQGNYENQFEAIPSTVSRPPTTNTFALPICEDQSAVVKENNDPEKMGRIRVQFYWQKDNEMSPWLRIVTPSGGESKGMYFIPEVGEEVLVGFESLNPEKPYIIGSFYNGKNKPDGEWITSDNNIKAFRTRSGHTIIFSDEDGKEYIKIYDNKDHNAIRLNPNEKQLKLWSKGDIMIEANNILMSASGKIEMKADKDIEVKSKEDFKLEVKGEIKAKAMKDAKVEAMNIENKAKMKFAAQGAQSELKGSAMTTIKGAIVKIN